MKKTVKLYKRIIFAQAIAILALVVGGSLYLIRLQSEKPNPNHDVITEYDRAGLERVEELANRFNSGKGDSLLFVASTIDSGPWIHDAYSNGKEIRWIVDNTRDVMSADRGKTEYICESIQIEENEDYRAVVLSKCDGYPDEEKLGWITFPKEKL
ncbi:hypothetical protein [Cohnella cellulosilytica]|uniref:DUF4362 domain-containing protein n=1 Tax=Cohnella cellulosilytica TaxID=986710 RepID=A0ABW2FJC0_9BACL